jgi:hypothetical protein
MTPARLDHVLPNLGKSERQTTRLLGESAFIVYDIEFIMNNGGVHWFKKKGICVVQGKVAVMSLSKRPKSLSPG